MTSIPARAALGILLIVGSEWVHAEQTSPFVAGKTVDFPWAGMHHKEIEVSLPTNWNASKRWPVMIFYSGVFGGPDAGLVGEITGNRDWVVIGLGHVRNDVFDSDEALIEEELEECRKVIKAMIPRLSIDRQRVFVGGFSKGGWTAAMFVDRDHAFAGAMVLGAGVNMNQKFKPKRFGKRTPVYVGVGQTDGNYVFSLRAKVYWRKLGAEVTFDEYAGIGHRMPHTEDHLAHLKQWLRIAAELETNEQARAWVLGREDTLDKEPDLLRRYLGYERMREAPLLGLAGKEAQKQVELKLANLRKMSALSLEWKVEQLYRDIKRKEIAVRTLDQLRACAGRFKSLAEEYPQTHFGKRAREDVPRVMTMLPAE